MRAENGQLRRWASYSSARGLLPSHVHDKLFLVVDAAGIGLQEPGRVWVLMDGMLEHWAFFMIDFESEVIDETG